MTVQKKVKLGEKAIKAAFDNFNNYNRPIINKEILVVLDYTQPSSNKRLYVIDVATKEILRNHHMAHGEGSSDPKDRNYAIKFSNQPGSHMSSLGAMVTADTYRGKHGYSLRLKGLEQQNSNVMRRGIVIHCADYVTDEYIKDNGRAGQSHGCPAVDPAIYKELIQLIKDGVFVYAYYQ